MILTSTLFCWLFFCSRDEQTDLHEALMKWFLLRPIKKRSKVDDSFKVGSVVEPFL